MKFKKKFYGKMKYIAIIIFLSIYALFSCLYTNNSSDTQYSYQQILRKNVDTTNFYSTDFLDYGYYPKTPEDERELKVEISSNIWEIASTPKKYNSFASIYVNPKYEDFSNIKVNVYSGAEKLGVLNYTQKMYDALDCVYYDCKTEHGFRKAYDIENAYRGLCEVKEKNNRRYDYKYSDGFYDNYFIIYEIEYPNGDVVYDYSNSSIGWGECVVSQ